MATAVGIGRARTRVLHRLANAGVVLLATSSACSVVLDAGYVSIGTASQSMSVGNVPRIVFCNAFGSIHVKPSRDDELHVTFNVKVLEASKASAPPPSPALDLKMGPSRDGFVVASAHFDYDTPHPIDRRVDLEIEAPTSLPWSISNPAGEVVVEADGNDVFMDVALGRVRLTGSVGKLEIETNVGGVDVDVTSLAGGHVRTRGGEFSLRVSGPGPTEDLSCTIEDGDVKVALGPASACVVDLTTSVGKIRVEGAALKTESRGRGSHAAGSIGSGGPRLAVYAGTGDLDFHAGK